MISTLYSCRILMKFEFSRKICEKSSNIKFHENSSSGNRVVLRRQRDTTKLNHFFWQLCESAYKFSPTLSTKNNLRYNFCILFYRFLLSVPYVKKQTTRGISMSLPIFARCRVPDSFLQSVFLAVTRSVPYHCI